jgi:hypothetical protein
LLAEIFGKAVELMLPEHSVRLQPLRCLLHRRSMQTTASHTTLPPALHESCSLEHGQVLAYARQCHGERLSQLTHPQLSARQPCDNGAARGVCQRSEYVIEAGILLVNHSV